MWELIILFTLSLVLLHWFFINPYGHWKKRRVPHSTPKFFFGNLKDAVFLKKHLGQVYKEIYDEYKDYLYVGYYKFRKPGIILRDMDLIKNVLVKDFTSFHDNDLHIDVNVDPLFGNNPFCLPGMKWKKTRSIITTEMTSSKIKNMSHLISNACKSLVEYIEKKTRASNEELEGKSLASLFTTEVVASCAFGLEAKAFSDSESDFRSMGKKFLATSFWTGIQHMIIFILPALSKLLRIKFLTTEVEEWLRSVVKETMRYRQENNIVRNDYLDMLIGIRSKPGYEHFTDRDITAQVLTFYLDGFDTSSTALSHTLYELGENPEVQEKLRDEVDRVLKKYKGEISYEAIQEMSYLDNVLCEGLRKYSPLLFMVRLCTKRFQLPPPQGEGTGPNVIIEPGTPVVIPILGIHQDPVHYPHPEKYDPDRFTDENRQMRHKYTFLAFGEGPRICLGMRFGIAQSKAALVAIVSNFEIKANPKTQRPLTIDPRYIFRATEGGLWLNFIKRKT